MSERTKKTLLIVAGCIALIIGGWWSYFQFTTIRPPTLEKVDANKVEEVVSYYGNPRGLIRLPVDQQEEYMVRVYQQFSRGEARAQYLQALKRMSSGERELLQNSVFEIMRKNVSRMAKEYRETPSAQRDQYIRTAMKNLEAARNELGGGVPGGEGNMGESFKQGAPLKTEDLAKLLVTRTDSQERAEAEPFINAMADRYKQDKAAKR